MVLKKPGRHDRQALVSAIGDWEVAKWLSRVPYPYTLSDADDWLQTASESALNLNIFHNNTLIGGVGLTLDSDVDEYELGYWLGRAYWRKGYATEAARGLLNQAIQTQHPHRLTATCIKGNEHSARVLEKLGFIIIGEDEIYSCSRKQTMPCITLVLAV